MPGTVSIRPSRGRNLELLVEARDDTASGGSGQTNLVIDNDGSVDAGAHQGVDNDVKVSLQRSTRVAHGHPHVEQAGVLLLQLLNMGAQGLDVLDLNLLGILVDVHILELATILLSPGLAGLLEGNLLFLDRVTGDIAKLSVLSDLVGRPGAEGLTVDPM